jgi:hypothetical protein
MLLFMIISAAFLYLVGTGGGYRFAEVNHRRKCPKSGNDRCSTEIGGPTSVWHEWPEMAWFIQGLLWPVLLPATIGMALFGAGTKELVK